MHNVANSDVAPPKRAILLCAGRGSRLDPLTRDRPKCLVAAGGVPILDQQIQSLRACGIDDVIIIGGYRHGDIADHIAAMSPSDQPELILNPFWASTNSIGSVWAAIPRLADQFVVINGDTLFDAEIMSDLIERSAAGINLGVCTKPLEADDMKVLMPNDRIIAVSKQLPPSPATKCSMGIVIVRDGAEDYVDALTEVIGEEHGPQQFHHKIIDRLALRGLVNPVVTDDMRWQEVDRPEDIDQWQRMDIAA